MMRRHGCVQGGDLHRIRRREVHVRALVDEVSGNLLVPEEAGEGERREPVRGMAVDCRRALPRDDLAYAVPLAHRAGFVQGQVGIAGQKEVHGLLLAVIAGKQDRALTEVVPGIQNVWICRKQRFEFRHIAFAGRVEKGLHIATGQARRVAGSPARCRAASTCASVRREAS